MVVTMTSARHLRNLLTSRGSWIIDCAFTTLEDTDILLFLDNSNCLVMTCFLDQHKGEEVWKNKFVHGSPSKLALIDSSTAVISLPYHQSLAVLRINLLHPVSVLRSVSTPKDYWGLAKVSGDTLLASCNDQYPVTIDMIDFTGDSATILKSFTSDAMGTTMFCKPDYLRVLPNGDMLISDWGQNGLISFSKDRNVNFRFQSSPECRVICPVGFDCDGRGDIYIADRDTNSVFIVSSEGKYRQTLLSKKDGVICPLCICIKGDKLCLTLESGCIMVFEITRNLFCDEPIHNDT